MTHTAQNGKAMYEIPDGPEAPDFHPTETQDEKQLRTARQVAAIERDEVKAKPWPIRIGHGIYRYPVVRLDDGMWAIVGDICFPVEKDYSRRAFILDENMSQRTLQELISRHPCSYEFVKWF